jgi:hypothetical protein
MARQPSLDRETQTPDLLVIQRHARRLAQGNEDLDVKLAQAGLEKLVATFNLDNASDPEWLAFALNQFPFSLLEIALESLPTADAVALVVQTDVEVLARRILATEYLVSDDTPLYTLSELHDHLKDFINYLECDREHFIRTGLPRKCFRPCPWLYQHLARLYDVRCTGSPYPNDEIFHNYPDNAEAYQWGRYVPVTTTPDDYPEDLPLPVLWQPCEYEQADFLPRLKREDALRLEGARATLFDLKLEVLRLLKSAARRKDATRLWENCLGLLTDRLLAEEADFFLGMDHYYLGTDVRHGSAANASAKMIPGGLTNLLELIGHVEKEITIGTLDKTRPRLFSVSLPGSEDSSPFNSADPRQAYFRRGVEHGFEVLDATLDLFLFLADKEETFWNEYRCRVTNAVENEFSEEVDIRCKVKRKLRHIFEPNLRTFAPWAATVLEHTGQMPISNLDSSVITSSSASTPKRPLAHFQRIPDLQWGEVSMTFISLESIQVKAFNTTRTYSYLEMGFKDGRKKNTPDSRWFILYNLAKQGGKVSPQDKEGKKVQSRVKTAIKDIRKRLCDFMGIEEDPFLEYAKAGGYHTKFTLKDGTFEQTEAALKEED